MSAGGGQDRTEAPTQRKRADAKRKGQVPRSQEVGAAALLLAGAAVVSLGGDALAVEVRDLFGASVLRGSTAPLGVAGYAGWVRGVGWTVLGMMLPFLLAMAGTALLVGGVQARGVLSLEPLRPKGEKLDPIKNIGRLWGWRAPMELLKSILKLAVVALAVWWVLQGVLDEAPALAQQSPAALLFLLRDTSVRVLATAGAAVLVLAGADYGWQVWQHEKQLRMTKQEVKQENKESEGDPNMKARRRSMGRSLARRRMLLAVSEADVVVTNPTHIAVALKYDPALADAPVVVAMGARKTALRIRQLAREAGVPIIENKPLARTLLATAAVGMPVPVEVYVAVAEILAFVFKSRGSAPGAAR